MIKWDDLTIRVTLPDGTKQQSHARVTNFSSRKNWLIEAEEGPTLEYGCTMDTDELEKWISSYPAGSVVVTKRKKEDFPYKYFNPADGWFGRKDQPDEDWWFGKNHKPKANPDESDIEDKPKNTDPWEDQFIEPN